MLLHYKGGHVWWYDLAGYGKEGKIEGMTIEELEILAKELTEEVARAKKI